jgi:hypothetical protein
MKEGDVGRGLGARPTLGIFGDNSFQIGVNQVDMAPVVAENLCTTIEIKIIKRRHLRASSYFSMLLIDGES